jgi:methionyl-tRNA synthetase
MGAGLQPPRQILVHGHWTLDGQKMSKSLGNVVSPAQVLDTFHPDIIRFYMIKEGGKEGDGNWSNDRIRDRSTYLANSWGNLISRMMSSKFNLRQAVENVFGHDNKETHGGVSSHLPQEDAKLREIVDSTVDRIGLHMNQLDFQAALLELEQLWRVVLYTTHLLLIIGEPICYYDPALDLCCGLVGFLLCTISNRRGDADRGSVCSTFHARESS